ncbi:DUF4129 domain-containing protein [Nocardioides sp. dk884]|uniref:DUF4129 domain-containing protein n=1 Tax=Nocardioides sp. dk884 TaxID=2662361 RepID=UPI00129730CA|nr:DUF4129 domain-containing protein [Nocardioides sp. dk884]QGA06577.1 DUF4129 domain-containing protein [Nocardioides sp. dk884]
MTPPAGAARAVLSPLDPSPEEARELVRRELLRSEYHDRDLIERLLTWVERQLGTVADAASAAPPLSTLAAMLVLLALVLALGWLLSRARRSARVRPSGAAVLTDEPLTAADLRARARAAHAAGRHEDAVVDGFRAIALAQLERDELAAAPGRTAHEVAEALAVRHPGRAAQAREAGLLFDLVRYGDRSASPAAAAVLALDADLAGVAAR